MQNQADNISVRDRETTILFTDVEGSTELRSRRGDRVADEILALHERIVRAAIEHHAGVEVSFLGDGFMASFTEARDAVRCALAIEEALDDHNCTNPDRSLRVRIGVHTGEVSERDGTMYGQTVHAASRITFEATGGQILISSLVRDRVEHDPELTFRDRGLFWLKGFPERWRLHEVERRGNWTGGRAVAIGRTPLVGRDAERADLRRALDAAIAGRGRLVFVSGEAGVGKTRLTLEVDAEAQARRMRVLVGHCIEMEGAAPYLPFVEILEEALIGPRSPQALREALGDAAPEIARMVPGLRRVIPDLAPPVDLPPEHARRYLWLALQEFLERATRDRPLMLVLEDLHWADESTLLLVDYLTPHLARMPLLIVGTYRDTEVGLTHPLARTVNQLGRRRLATRIALKRLPEADVAGMVRALAGHEPPSQLVHVINAESDGNPLFVEEVFLHLAESGRLLEADGRFRTDLHIDEFDVPDSVRLVVGERLERLSDAARRALVAAAMIGRAFGPELVERIAELSPEAVLDALDEGERARLITPSKADGSHLEFVHELIRQTLLADTSSVRRRRLHARTAAAIEEVYADDIDAHAADLAYHLSRAEARTDPARLVQYLLVAGKRGTDASAFEDAVAHYEHAAELVPESDRRLTAEVLERLAMARRSVGRWDDALRAMDKALELYEELGRTDALGRLAWAMVFQLLWAGRIEEAVFVAGKALGALGDTESVDRARILGAAGWAFGLGGDHDTSTEMLSQARELAERLGDERALADVLHLQTINHMGFAQFPEGIATGLRAAKVFERQGALWDLASVLSFVLFQQGTMGRIDDATALLERVKPLANRLMHLGAVFMTLSHRVRVEGVMAGNVALIADFGRRQVEVCAAAGLPWLYVGHVYRGLAAHWSGDWEVAERELRMAVELEPPAAFAGQSASLLALHLAYAGRRGEALAIVQEHNDALPVAGRVNTLGAWNTAFAFVEVLFVLGEREAAAALEPLVQEALALGVEWITFDCRWIHSRAALAAAAGGRFDRAEEHFREAMSLARSAEHRIEQAALRREHAAMLLERDGNGDRQRARELLEAAVGDYRAMGMPRYLEMAEAALAGA